MSHNSSPRLWSHVPWEHSLRLPVTPGKPCELQSKASALQRERAPEGNGGGPSLRACLLTSSPAKHTELFSGGLRQDLMLFLLTFCSSAMGPWDFVNREELSQTLEKRQFCLDRLAFLILVWSVYLFIVRACRNILTAVICLKAKNLFCFPQEDVKK